MAYYDAFTLITEYAHAIQTNLNIKLTLWDFSYFITCHLSMEGKWNEKAKLTHLSPNLRFVALDVLFREFLVPIDLKMVWRQYPILTGLKKQVKKNFIMLIKNPAFGLPFLGIPLPVNPY